MRKLLLAYIAWWSFWALVQAMLLHRMGLNWELAGVDAMVSNTLMALAGFATTLLYSYYQPGRGNRIYRFVYGIGITFFFCVTLAYVLRYTFSNDEQYIAFLERSMPVRFVFSFMIISFITVLNWLWNTLKEQKEYEKRNNDAEKLAREAELSKLRQQLQPHFLFNSLNSISALAGSKPNEARKMIQQLSDFLRGTLKKDELQVVKFDEELQHLKLYLDIEKVRFGHRLNIDIQASEESMGLMLPPLLLQPIVENAIKFGLYDTTGDIVITLRSYTEGPYLHIDITNPYDPQTSSPKGTGFGLSSVQRRLFLLYARQDLLLAEAKDKEFITRLKIPQTL